MSKTAPSLKEKIFLFSLGLFLTFIILEVGLRIGGSILTARQNALNASSFAEDEFRILCIGESTTALGRENSYPSQLEDILNESQNGIAFKVINRGQVGKTTKDILLSLNDDLEKYKPHLVIAMIGINDSLLYVNTDVYEKKTPAFIRSLRTYKFFKLLKTHITHSLEDLNKKKGVEEEFNTLKSEDLKLDSSEVGIFAEPHYDSDRIDIALNKFAELQTRLIRINESLGATKDTQKQDLLEKEKILTNAQIGAIGLGLAHEFRMRGEYVRSEQFAKIAAVILRSHFGAYLELGRLYKDQKQYTKAMIFLQKAASLNPDSHYVYMDMGRVFNEIGQKTLAAGAFKKVLELKPSNNWVFYELGQWFLDHQLYKEAEEALLEALKRAPEDYVLFDLLAKTYKGLGDEVRAKEYFQKAQELQETMIKYQPFTVENYNSIVNILRVRRIPVICMQYPLLSIDPLKDIIWNSQGILFAENKTNFETALKDAQYSKYFKDFFAGKFGHCTRDGNRVIAQNLANLIKEQIKTP